MTTRNHVHRNRIEFTRPILKTSLYLLAAVELTFSPPVAWAQANHHLPNSVAKVQNGDGYSDGVSFVGPVQAGNTIPGGTYHINNAAGSSLGFTINANNDPPGYVYIYMDGGNSIFGTGYGDLPFIPTRQYPDNAVPWGQSFTADHRAWTLNDSANNVVGRADGGVVVSGSCFVGGTPVHTDIPMTYTIYYDPTTDRHAYPPPQQPSGPLMTSTEQAAPVQYRKVAFNGRPLSDGKPQTAPETDAASEESFVDAFTLGLRHDTTDIYVPVASTDLVLQVRRSTASEVWSQRQGLSPAEMPDRPFGSGWTSNLAANIHFVRQTPQISVPLNLDADYAYVTDEDGSTYRFLIAKGSDGVETYVPLPGARNQQDSYLNTLVGDSQGHWTFRRKFGTTLTYQNAGIDLLIPNDRINPASSYLYETHSFARVTQVTDRTGVALIYSYSSSGGTIIPNEIEVQTATGSRPGQRLLIDSDAQGKVQHVTDPMNKIWDYAYQTQDAPTTCATLSSVTAALDSNSGLRPTTVYGYSVTTIDDTLPGYPSTPHLHCDVNSIKDPKGKVHTITYQADQSCKVQMPLQGFLTVPGLPRVVSKIDLPDSIGTTSFENHSFIAAVTDYSSSLIFYGHKANYVVDAAGNGRLYQFLNPSLNVLTSFKPFLPNREVLDPFRVPRIVLFQGEKISSFNNRNIVFNEVDPNNFSFSAGAGTASVGDESYTFDLLAGMAPASATDMSLHTTQFTYGDTWDFSRNYAALSGTNYAFGKYADPTAQIDARNKTKTFSYFPAPAPGVVDVRARRLTQIVDEEQRKTIYTLDPHGNRTSEMIYDPAGRLIQWTEFEYNDPRFPGFMTKRILHAGGNDVQ